MHRLLLCSALVLMTACDTAGPAGSSEPTAVAVARESGSLTSTSASPFALALDPYGTVASAPGESTASNPYVLFSSGLWVAGRQDGAARAAFFEENGRSYAPCTDGSGGVFHLFADSTYAVEGWPASHGAPVDASGAPRVYGSEMLWTTLCQAAPNLSTFASVARFDALRTNVAVYRQRDAANTVFVRYDVTNTGATPIADARVGLWSDNDVSVPDGGQVYDNLTGSDPALGLAYVYFASRTSDVSGRALTDAERGHVAGVTVLETPGGAGLAAHRILTKRGADYGPPTSYTAQTFLDRLRALRNDGTPQTDWTTGQPAALAFTGDPVAETGWIDGTGPLSVPPSDRPVGRESRMLLGTGDVTLAPGQTTTLTVAWTVVNEPSLAAGFRRLRERISGIRSNPSLWRF